MNGWSSETLTIWGTSAGSTVAHPMLRPPDVNQPTEEMP